MIYLDFIKRFYDVGAYQKIYKQSVWRSLLYVFILSLIIYTAGAFVDVTRLNKGLIEGANAVIQTLPDFSVEDGQLTMENEKYYKYSSEGNVLIVDLKDEDDISNYKDAKTTVMLKRDHIVLMANGEQNSFKYSDIQKSGVLQKLNITTLNKTSLLNSIPLMSQMFKKYAIIFFVFAYIFWLFLWKFWSILILSLIALIVGAIMKANLRYKEIFNISVYALTLPWIIKLAYKFGSTYVSHSIYFLIYWAVAILYVSLAIRYIRNNTPKPEVLAADGPQIVEEQEAQQIVQQQESEEVQENQEPQDKE